MNKINKIFFLLSIMPVILLSSCDFAVPIKEMSLAKAAITRAMEVKAEKYAPDEFKKAKNHLLKSHTYIKDEDSDNAKKEAKNSEFFLGG